MSLSDREMRLDKWSAYLFLASGLMFPRAEGVDLCKDQLLLCLYLILPRTIPRYTSSRYP